MQRLKQMKNARQKLAFVRAFFYLLYRQRELQNERKRKAESDARQRIAVAVTWHR